jgi:prophage antirepressor-like protein
MLLPSAGGSHSTKVIPERDVYRLIMRSRPAES